jgi:hypothetical protein
VIERTSRGLMSTLTPDLFVGGGFTSLNYCWDKTSCLFRESFPEGSKKSASVGERDFDARRFRSSIYAFF